MQWWRRFVGRNAPGYYQRRRNAQSNAILGLLIGFTVVYFAAEFILARQIHPIHWLAAGIGAVLLYTIGYVWLLRREYLRSLDKRKI